MTDSQLRGLCRAIAAGLAAATVGRWIGAALPFEGWPHTVVAFALAAVVALVILGAISGPPAPTATLEDNIEVTHVNNTNHVVEVVSHDA